MPIQRHPITLIRQPVMQPLPLKLILTPMRRHLITKTQRLAQMLLLPKMQLDNAQTEVLTHAALPHNTDQVARDGVDTAQQTANAAGSVAMDANAAAVTAGQTATDAETDAAAADQRILSHIAAHPGSTINAVFSPNADGSFPEVTQDMYDDGAVLISPRTLRVPFRYPDGGTTRNMAFWGDLRAR